MKRQLFIPLLLVLTIIAACQGGLPPTEILIEVTRVVTVVVTADPNQQGPLPVATPEATDAVEEVTVEATVELTPSVTPTPDPFPTPVVGQIFVAEQVFQRGRMFWLRPIDQIWVLTTDDDENQIWQVAEDLFEDGMTESDPAFAPTEPGLIQPIRGFGLLWRENQDIRQNLGWAIAEEVGYLANYEYHYGGTIDENNIFIAGSGYHLIETLSREVIRFNEGTWTWEIVKAEE